MNASWAIGAALSVGALTAVGVGVARARGIIGGQLIAYVLPASATFPPMGSDANDILGEVLPTFFRGTWDEVLAWCDKSYAADVSYQNGIVIARAGDLRVIGWYRKPGAWEIATAAQAGS